MNHDKSLRILIGTFVIIIVAIIWSLSAKADHEVEFASPESLAQCYWSAGTSWPFQYGVVQGPSGPPAYGWPTIAAAMDTTDPGSCGSYKLTHSGRNVIINQYTNRVVGIKPHVCGDGVKETDEACDDGNVVSGDGCSSICEIEVPPDPVVLNADLSWTAPTLNTDGSPLTDLAGFIVYYGLTQGGPYTTEEQINDPAAVGLITQDISPDGMYYFVVTAFDSSGNESAFSNEVSKEIIGNVVVPPPPPPTGGELLRLPMDEGSGAVAVDATGLGHDGTLLNGAAFSSDTGDGSASSVRFIDANDVVDVGTVPISSTGFTVAAWFKASGFAIVDARLVTKATGENTPDHIFMLGTNTSGSNFVLRSRVRVNGVTQTFEQSTGATFNTGTWHHAVLTYDGTAQRLYLDGVPSGSFSQVGTFTDDPVVPVQVGNQNGVRHFEGWIDNVQIYDRALSDAEVAAL